ncbi:hypothetical protein LC1Hm_2110 [Halomicrobium sp. LC1Hm]|nr:hypothetical protein LC1Hm_2110 [Halomicrobium sp. LC1Hm]
MKQHNNSGNDDQYVDADFGCRCGAPDENPVDGSQCACQGKENADQLGGWNAHNEPLVPG